MVVDDVVVVGVVLGSVGGLYCCVSSSSNVR